MTPVDDGPETSAVGREDADRLAAAWQDPKLANVLYHDWEASTYDDKWSISYDERCIRYARERFEHVAGTENWPYERALELGSGTGFFLLNCMQAGIARTGVLTDISPGMVAAAQRNGRELGLVVSGEVVDAEKLPFADESFDLVLGHAFLHHIPDVDQCLREVVRVLRPGGRFVFCGEPTRYGDAVARRLSRATWWAARRITHLPGLRSAWARPIDELDASSQAAALEAVVDLHTFDPAELSRACRRAGAVDVHTVTEELTAAWFGWPVRTFEAAVAPGRLGWGWAQFAYRSWLGLSWADEHVLDRVVPDALFYNVSVTGVRSVEGSAWRA